jgi:hypothetical protein
MSSPRLGLPQDYSQLVFFFGRNTPRKLPTGVFLGEKALKKTNYIKNKKMFWPFWVGKSILNFPLFDWEFRPLTYLSNL